MGTKKTGKANLEKTTTGEAALSSGPTARHWHRPASSGACGGGNPNDAGSPGTCAENNAGATVPTTTYIKTQGNNVNDDYIKTHGNNANGDYMGTQGNNANEALVAT